VKLVDNSETKEGISKS